MAEFPNDKKTDINQIPEDNVSGFEEQSPMEMMSYALKLGFNVLKLIMLAMAVFFVFSNIFWINEGYVGLQTRFGQIVERDNGVTILKPGGPYFALPSPIDKVVKIPTTMQKLPVDKAFWIENQNPEEPEEEQRCIFPALIPGYDGSLITGDKNIVQGKWAVNFQVGLDFDSKVNRAPMLYAANVGNMERARELVGNVVQQSIVKVVAQVTIDEFVRGKIDNLRIQALAQQTLDSLQTGLRINSVSPEVYSVPMTLVEHFQSVNRAQSEKAEQIEDAQRYRTQNLNETAGKNYRQLISAINKYEEYFDRDDKEKLKETDHEIRKLLNSPLSEGDVAEVLNYARLYKTRVIEEVKGKAKRFEKLLEQYKKNPVILKSRLVQDAVQEVFSGNVRTFYLPQGQGKTIYIDLDTKLPDR